MTVGRVVLVKHAQPILYATKPASEWVLAVEGEEQSKRLGASLRRFVPCRLLTSPEPKALRTCEIVAAELGISMSVVDGLREIDRPILPIMAPSEHQRLESSVNSTAGSWDVSRPGRRWSGSRRLCGQNTAELTEITLLPSRMGQ